MTSTNQPGLLRKMNEHSVLEIIQEHGSVYLADVTRFSEISAPTVSQAVVSLLKAAS